ncbi:7-carboxy-7-deazaguanine synthase [Sphingomonas colocasiae]|uniref:7-carboxy-7-deazaguanine synthase n=1 Tax=Sphingomonas colocasiae TaxID=1848973 RepID=A0ABS7PN85_9SPHN|nr:7-carboxy-7-deazaguanine synthase [Sphingomonas colocasiae]MBY8822733.1 7-carboxy-7-deazaguanine synthase [Sphingomonas colocasiae]
MSYAVKEMFLTLQGEGRQAGRRAVFLRFAGCNLWTGREQDRADAICRFCDTDFVGLDGTDGGRYPDAAALAARAGMIWGEDRAHAYIVCTGGEPLLQLDEALIAALHGEGFEVAVETNGTIAAPAGLDWICVSPKAGSDVVQRSGDELKLVWPQPGSDVDAMEGWDFGHLLVQPMDDARGEENVRAAIDFAMARPKWRLSLQTHKHLGLR